MKTEPNTARPASQILATLGPSLGQQTTPPPKPDLTASAKLKRKVWLDKWLGLRQHNPLLETAANSIYGVCSDYAKSPSIGRTVVIFGANGAGKSHTSKAVFRWAKAIAQKLPIVKNGENEFGPPAPMFAHWPKIVDKFKEGEWAIIDDFMETALLVLDDIGAVHDPSTVGAEKLYILLSHREKRWNIVTTNVAPGEWPEKFERHIASRLFRNAQHIDLSQVPDYSAFDDSRQVTASLPYKDT